MTYDRRRTQSDDKSSHSLWQGELKTRNSAFIHHLDSVCVQSRMQFLRKSSSFISHMILCPGIEVVMDSQSTQKRLEYIVSDKKLFYLFFCRYRLLNYYHAFVAILDFQSVWQRMKKVLCVLKKNNKNIHFYISGPLIWKNVWLQYLKSIPTSIQCKDYHVQNSEGSVN